jgi:20S proteasome alpha/beta subunit
MTVAIGARCIRGALLIADRNIVAPDGSKTTGCKIYSRDFNNGSIALAGSTNDAWASECLAEQIIQDVSNHACDNPEAMAIRACDTMQIWHNAYGASGPPSIQYLMVACAGGNLNLYLMDPPRTKLEKHAYAIGGGSRVAEQSLDRIIPTDIFRQPEATLMYLMFLAKQAEKYEVDVGGGFDALYVPVVGKQVPLDKTELMVAGEAVGSVDECTDLILQSVMSMTEDDTSINIMTRTLSEHIAFLTKELGTRDLFPTLAAALRPSASRTLKPEQ